MMRKYCIIWNLIILIGSKFSRDRGNYKIRNYDEGAIVQKEM